LIYIRDFGWRLGNQMFQIATAIGLALENNDTVWYPEWQYADKFCGDFKNQEGAVPTPGRIFTQVGHHYEKIPYVPNMVLSGYFQSEKYFKHCEDGIRALFEVRVTPPRRRMAEHECAIHVRLGDYVQLQNHHPVKTWKNYYESAVEKYYEQVGHRNVLFKIFSDEPNRAAQEFPTDGRFEVIDMANETYALWLMSQHEGNIIGNSSFSWWSAWLNPNPNKVVIAPQEWFGQAYSVLNLKDLIPPEWHKV
jgi:hypothetical protein